ncbi:hypothetical protein FDP41_005902 [Naegleria fowleri]|uniref:Uncharacterized protein n=1 Tax=Naegleria fowleri TaxID=5763 RepID=A0A6A5BQB4_NAEFO|nr:uncharacterized protein FDP41_005902 [Naegleria fowleri]KAF0975149.1 hypothetical protein FDP41_005902 [Naegleria fowleri]
MSHAANLIKMQQQIRNNAQEYSDFVSDLKKWTKDISEKDKKLQEGSQKKKYRPVRGTSEPSIDPDEEAEKLKETGNDFF